MHSRSINKSHVENATMVLNGNTLIFKKGNDKIKLSKNQSKLMACLISEGNEKENIINYIWGAVDCKSRENSYNQLVFKTKELLKKQGLPKDMIITMPGYGLCINKNYTRNLVSPKKRMEKMYNDRGILSVE